jgi:2-methylisocitrate lyase-like PEP mutase family enzyme
MGWLQNRLEKSPAFLRLPGAYDALSARVIEMAGAEAVYCGGFACTASSSALPDLGLLSVDAMLAGYARIRRAVPDLPVIVDGDTGHGGLLNVERTIQGLIEIGIDGVHIEDQVMPKRCGHLAGKEVVDRSDAVARVRTAIAVSAQSGLAIIGRTDALGPIGITEAIWRANAFLQLGAAAVLIDAPGSLADLEMIGRQVDGPVIFNAAPTGRGPLPSAADLHALGFAASIHPIEGMLAAATAVWTTTSALLAPGERPQDVDWDIINSLLQTDQFLAREAAFAAGDRS